jgi:hypothetical protein
MASCPAKCHPTAKLQAETPLDTGPLLQCPITSRWSGFLDRLYVVRLRDLASQGGTERRRPVEIGIVNVRWVLPF